MRVFLVTCGTVLFVAGYGTAFDLGSLDQKPPAKEVLVVPKSDEGIEKVSVHERVKGMTAKDEKRSIYIVVNPLSNPATVNTWWVQRRVSRDGESFAGVSQFGEGNQGIGEYFAIVAVATDKEWPVGRMLNGLPDDATYTTVKIVKRN